MIQMREWVSKEPPYSTTTYKAVWTVWLWIGTAATTLLGNLVLMVLAFVRPMFVPPAMIGQLYDSWLFALVAFSGVTTAEFYGKRATHTPTVEAKARAKMAMAMGQRAPVAVEHAEQVVASADAGDGGAEQDAETPEDRGQTYERPAQRATGPVERAAHTEPNIWTDNERGD